ncbi:hypothetical protein [Actinoplanes rectilineatus]|uniref:hypothetical protein n=1 Tax=Actinoplanes rectilineatus TaxID=113571 RepID=UPI0006969504|nr:hypothetical protein [Actinoplanes rectilineatus]
MDEAVLQARHDFYRDADTLIATAINQARAHHRDTNADRHAELDAIEAAITAKTTARDKYRTAFENGTMDEEDTGPRLRELRTEIEALKVRPDEITDLISDEPVAPSPSTLAKTRARLEHVITNGESAERKAIIEELIAEIRIIGEEIIPVFRLPRYVHRRRQRTGSGSRNAKPGGAGGTRTRDRGIMRSTSSVDLPAQTLAEL